jgi:hypothetical protein
MWKEECYGIVVGEVEVQCLLGTDEMRSRNL